MSTEPPELALLRVNGPKIIEAFEADSNLTLWLAGELNKEAFIAKTTYINVRSTIANVGATAHMHTLLQSVRGQISVEQTDEERKERLGDFLKILDREPSTKKLKKQLQEEYGR